MSIPPSGAGTPKIDIVKILCVLKWQNTFNLGLTADVDADKTVQIKNCSEFNFLKKKLSRCVTTSPRSGPRGSSLYSNRAFDEIAMPIVWSLLPPLLR